MYRNVNKEQRKLDRIQSWLARTTEEFDDWDYNGEELIIILRDKIIERYNNLDIKEILEEFQ
jgi:uncharacterized protein YacL (UPF0231 family)